MIEEKQEKEAGFHLKLLEKDRSCNLPPRVEAQTSAWFAPHEGETVLRGVRHSDRTAQFIIRADGTCLRVPTHLSQADWRNLSWDEPTQLLMIGISNGLRALARFERLDYIHSQRCWH